MFQVYFIPYLSKFRLFWQFLWGFCELFSISDLQFWTISTFFDWVEDWRYQTFMQHYSKLLTSSMLIIFFLLKDIFFEFRKIIKWVDIYMYQKFLIALAVQLMTCNARYFQDLIRKKWKLRLNYYQNLKSCRSCLHSYLIQNFSGKNTTDQNHLLVCTNKWRSLLLQMVHYDGRRWTLDRWRQCLT